ncbi:unnamed protein product, partial [Vitis vinifera]
MVVLRIFLTVDLSKNNLTGKIPLHVGHMTRLLVLRLRLNQFTGIIPDTLSNISGLELLDLSGNFLTGQVPDSLGMLKDLVTALRLEGQSLGGSLPPIGNLTFLRELVLSNNLLHGTIPSDIGLLRRMRHLNLSTNSLQGEIPIELTNCSNLETVDLTRNNLTGQIPFRVGNMSTKLLSLKILYLSVNNLSGTIPPSLYNFFPQLRKLGIALNQTISLYQNNFGGVLPNSIVNLSTQLQALHLGENKIFGNIPEEIGNLINLTTFDAGQNYLTGVVPTSVGKLQKLVTLRLSWNRLSGLLPSSLGNLSQLSLYLQQNTFTGSLPADVGQLKNLNDLNLSYNYLEGEVPIFEQRLDIAIDVACALDYLHHHCQTPIVHGDLKPSNVLLDDNMVAHVGDFGLTKLIPEATEISSSDHQTGSALLMGSIGYVAPEYGLGGSMWPQGDMYSYGILLLEMFTGKRPTDHMFSDGLNLHSFSKMALLERVMEIADSNLVGETQHCLASIARIGVACSEESPGDRLDIKDVVMELNIIKKVFLGAGIHGERHIRMQLPAEGTSQLGGESLVTEEEDDQRTVGKL